jgi:hypothetical protein
MNLNVRIEDMIDEHEHLLRVLRKLDKDEVKKEIAKQSSELEKYRGMLGKFLKQRRK